MGNCCECKNNGNYASFNMAKFRSNFVFKSEFLTFYVDKRREMVTKKFSLINDDNSLNLKTILSSQYLIPYKIADCWVSLYIDYMIGWAFDQINKLNLKLIPPYGIEAVIRTHICFQKDFLKFLALLTDGKYQLDFKP